MPSSFRYLVAVLLTVAIVVVGCAERSATAPSGAAPAFTGPVSVRGTVNYRQRVALPPTAIVRVQIVDVARADAPARVVASQVIAAKGEQVPFAFSLEAPADAVTPGSRLALQARIEVDGQLRFINTPAFPLSSQSAARPIEIVVQPVSPEAVE
jgi:putative lipoprotein